MTSVDVPSVVWVRIVALVDALVRREFDAASAGGRCRGDDLRKRIADYKRTLRRLPPAARADVHAVQREDGVLAIDVPLWTVEEGASDLELRIHAMPMDADWIVVIDDLLVP
ncbi:MAG: hypothetical protein NVS3B10_19700 [Polyangiales bacterium]